MKNLALALMVVAPMFAFADVKTEFKKIEVAADKCYGTPANQNTYGMNQCAEEEFQAGDKVLNRTYKEIMNGLRKDGNDSYTVETIKRLVESERAWIKFRDLDSTLEGIQMLNGSAETQLVIGNMYGMTKERTLRIAELFERASQN